MVSDGENNSKTAKELVDPMGGQAKNDEAMAIMKSLDFVRNFVDQLRHRSPSVLTSEMRREIEIIQTTCCDILLECDSKKGMEGSGDKAKKITVQAAEQGAIPKIPRQLRDLVNTGKDRKVTSLLDKKEGYSTDESKDKHRLKKYKGKRDEYCTDESELDASDVQSDEESAPELDSMSSDLESDVKDRKSRRISRHQRRDRDRSGTLVVRTNSKRVPELAKFDETTGQDLEAYLTKFERHCESHLEADKSYWVDELQNHLQGKILKVFRSITSINDSYSKVKRKLLTWYGDMRIMRKKKSRAAFKRAKYEEDETLYLYSSRLEKLFVLGYPQINPQTSKALREKYLASIPKSTSREIISEMRTTKLREGVVNWKMVQKMVRMIDVDLVEYGSEGEEEDEIQIIPSGKEIVINVGQEKVRDGQLQSEQNVGLGAATAPRTWENKNYQSGHNGRDYDNSAGYNHYRGYSNNRDYTRNYNEDINRSYRNEDNSNYNKENSGYNNNRNAYRDNNRNNYNNKNEHENRSGRQPGYRHGDGETLAAPPTELVRNNVTCRYCNRLGHEISMCRTRLRQCYNCGAGDHGFRDCPRGNGNNRDRSQSETRSDNAHQRQSSRGGYRSDTGAAVLN